MVGRDVKWNDCNEKESVSFFIGKTKNEFTTNYKNSLLLYQQKKINSPRFAAQCNKL